MTASLSESIELVIAKKAYQAMKRGTWWRGPALQPSPQGTRRMCLMTAYGRLRTNDVGINVFSVALAKIISIRIRADEAFDACTAWNDDPSRTKKEVLGVMKKLVEYYGGTV